jgi:threonyl-tRNA synthetase
MEKIPHILVVGDSDVEQRSVGVNRRGSDKPQRDVPLEAFRAGLAEEIATRGAPESAAAR